MRDIIDEPGAVKRAWDREGTVKVLRRYYEQRGFRPLGTTTLFGGMYTARLFERALRHNEPLP